MDLIVNKVNQFKDVSITNSHRLIECFTSTTINELNLARVLRVIDPFLTGLLCRLFEVGLDSLFGLLGPMHFIERHYLYSATEVGGSPAHQTLENLTHVHPRWHAQGVEHNVNRGTIGKIGHILPRKNTTNNSLVTVTASHLIPDLDFC
jgi:hypothetical protein